MSHRLIIAEPALDALAKTPLQPIEGKVNGSAFQARIGIPAYAENVARHYNGICGGKLEQLCRKIEIPPAFPNFGLVCEFDRPVELAVHDDDLTLDEGLRRIIDRFGPIIIYNASLPTDARREAQRNIFPNLNFHFDRGPNQPTQYSLFFRDPADPVQVKPRESSTVFVANVVAHLQYAKEGHFRPEDKPWRSRYDIFTEEEDFDGLVGDIVLEHAWNRPEGTGEISLLFNRTVLHASYYRKTNTKGYPIGVRYLK